MLDISDLQSYFRGLRKLSEDAQQFPWKPGAGSDVTELADELRCMLEFLEKSGHKEAAFEYFCREMLAECSPDNAAYYVSPLCSQGSSIRKHAWFAYSALRAVELANKPTGVTQAALTVCAALGVACKKTLAMLNAKSAEKALPPSPAFGLPAIGISLISKMRPEDRRAGFYVVSGS